MENSVKQTKIKLYWCLLCNKLNTWWMKITADLRQFISLLKIVGLLNVVISHQIRGNLCQSITHFIKGVIWQSHSSKL